MDQIFKYFKLVHKSLLNLLLGPIKDRLAIPADVHYANCGRLPDAIVYENTIHHTYIHAHKYIYIYI